MNEGLNQVKAEATESRREIEALATTTKRAAKDMREVIDKTTKSFANLGDEIAAVDAAVKDAFENADGGTAPQVPGAEKTKESTILDKINREVSDKLGQVLDNIFRSVEDALVDAILGERQRLDDLGKTIKNQFKALLKDLLRIILDEVREALTEALKPTTTSARSGGARVLGSVLGGIFGGGGATTAVAAPAGFRNASAGLIAEHGGTVATGVPVLVGEAGPEIFVPPSPGEIVPNDRLGGFGGGEIVTHVHYNIDARGAEPGVEQRIRRMLQETEKRAVDRAKYEIFNDARRGGIFSRLSHRR